jgi:hypothetical protein
MIESLITGKYILISDIIYKYKNKKKIIILNKN